MILSLLIDNASEKPADFLLFLGRIHPLVVHLPIGFLLLAALAEFATRKTKFEPIKMFTHYLWGLGAISSLFAVGVGYLLSLSGDYNPDTLFWHKWSGVAVLVLSVGCYYHVKFQQKLPVFTKSILVTVTVIALTYTGHLGGNLTHGSTYLLEYAPNPVRSLAGMPKKKIPRKKVTEIDSANVYLDLIAPMMERRCVSCHNDDKKKGELNLSSYSLMLKGGENAEVLVPGDLNSSDLYRRINLAEIHDDFMPSEGKQPLSAEEVKIIGWWIKNMAPSKGYFTQMNPTKNTVDLVKKYLKLDKNNLLTKTVLPPNELAVNSLTNEGFILNLLMKENYFLEANFNLSEKTLTDQSFESLFQIKEQLIWLTMVNSNVSDKHLEKIGQLENLIKLNLSQNSISNDGFKHLIHLKNLESLNLYETNVSDALLNVIPQLTHLKRLYISESKASNKVVNQLQNENQKLTIIFD
jgi:uncharacterized membrane protein